MDIIKLQLDSNKEYGIVLEGGRIKGAYQIGAWRALREVGIRIKGVAGTSVGVLNGALICMDDFEKAGRIRENISYSRVVGVGDEFMERLTKFSLKNISNLAPLNMRELIAGAIRVLRDDGFDIALLRALIEDVVDKEKIRNSDGELYAMTHSISGRHPLTADTKEAPEGGITDLPMASAYLPGFRQERLGGKYYVDDGGINNVPVDAFLDRGYRDVIVLRIYGYGVNTEKKLEVLEGTTLYHVAPRRDSGDFLESDRRRARRNMLLGYFDGECMLYGLAGRVYYIDALEDEPYYFDKMISEIQSPLSYMEPEPQETGETKHGREEQKDPFVGYRVYTEQVSPQLAKELKLKEEWDYKELYPSILEDLAKQYRISRSKIYTVEELLRLTHKKAGAAALKAMIPIPDNSTQVQYIMYKDA